jgi:purine-binding chemotaxis protein CheW
MTSAERGPGALHQVVVFLLDGQRYGLPVRAVERVVPMVALAPLPRAPAVALGVLNLHGRVLPVLDLARRFGRPPREWGPGSHLLVVQTRRRPLVLAVDEAVGVSEVAPDAVRPPETVLPGIEHVAGLVPLADGVLLIQDLDAVLSLDESRQLGAALDEVER